MREMLRGIERGWVESNIAALARPEKLDRVAIALVRGDRRAVSALPSTVGLGVEAVAERLLQASIKANAVKDVVVSFAAMVGPLRAMQAAVADVVIELRQQPPVRAIHGGDRAVAAWLASYSSKLLADWTAYPNIATGGARRRSGRACYDLERIGLLVGSQGERCALAVGWLGALGVAYQALRGELRRSAKAEARNAE
ncbi:hypothetical protein ACMU6081_11035 [Achromobacter mucicolens]|uniref:Uncharacterized protein n=1 Tax=Achromobacter mucicolens TaxID=1389922 RepID=A0ABM8LKK2_9BURK|nr:hypothetical protein MC81_32050 [Achromobacter insolitus]CAB3912477.1 hypothetical protein LMG3415_05047 [Achromobacter mucicolens]